MKTIIILILLSYNFIYSATVGKAAVIDTFAVTSFNSYCAAKGDTNVSVSIRKSIVLTNNLVMKKSMFLAEISNNAKVDLNGYTLTIKGITTDIPDSTFIGTGSLILEPCACSYFDTRWIGSSAISYVWRGCNGDTLKAHLFKVKTINGDYAIFDSIYVNQKFVADSIYAAKAKINKLNVSDSLLIGVNPWKIAKSGSKLQVVDTAGRIRISSSNTGFGINTLSNTPLGALHVMNLPYMEPVIALTTHDYTNGSSGSGLFFYTTYVQGNNASFGVKVNNSGSTARGTFFMQPDGGPIAIGKYTATSGYKLDVLGKSKYDTLVVDTLNLRSGKFTKLSIDSTLKSDSTNVRSGRYVKLLLDSTLRADSTSARSGQANVFTTNKLSSDTIKFKGNSAFSITRGYDEIIQGFPSEKFDLSWNGTPLIGYGGLYHTLSLNSTGVNKTSNATWSLPGGETKISRFDVGGNAKIDSTLVVDSLDARSIHTRNTRVDSTLIVDSVKTRTLKSGDIYCAAIYASGSITSSMGFVGTATRATIADSSIKSGRSVFSDSSSKSHHAVVSDSSIRNYHSILSDSSIKASRSVFADSTLKAWHSILADSSVKSHHAVVSDSAGKVAHGIYDNNSYTNPTWLESARKADSARACYRADIATSATYAGEATTAGYATNSGSAASATNASHATNSDYANNADHSTTATSSDNADKLDGQHGSYYSPVLTGAQSGHWHTSMFATSAPAGGPWWLYNEWVPVNGIYRWRLRSNHSDNVSVHHADSANYAARAGLVYGSEVSGAVNNSLESLHSDSADVCHIADSVKNPKTDFGDFINVTAGTSPGDNVTVDVSAHPGGNYKIYAAGSAFPVYITFTNGRVGQMIMFSVYGENNVCIKTGTGFQDGPGYYNYGNETGIAICLGYYAGSGLYNWKFIRTTPQGVY